jgi:uncharacterized RDD family membrane protein YckC
MISVRIYFVILPGIFLFSDHFGNPLWHEPASLPARGLAYIIDRLLLLIFWGLIIYALNRFADTETGKKVFESINSIDSSAADTSVFVEILTTIFIVLFIFAIYVLILFPITIVEYLLKGRSPGKLIFGLRIESTNGEAPSYIQILVRALIREVEGLLGLIFILATPQRQTFYDTLIGTVVVRYRHRSSSNTDLQKAAISKRRFTLPADARYPAIIWQRYYKTLQRSQNQSENVRRYLVQQASRHLIEKIPSMGSFFPAIRSMEEVTSHEELLHQFSDALDLNEVVWLNR